MHAHSIQSYAQGEEKFANREDLIFAYLETAGPMTDREIMRGLGYYDMNTVRPRITKMVKEGRLSEQERATVCPITGRKVRLVYASLAVAA